MNIETIEKGSFSVIGIAGSTDMGSGFIGQLWNEANSRFDEVAGLAKRDGDGLPVGCWGAMSDLSMSFGPWEDDFSKGAYLAGIECVEDAAAPEGWTKWTIPGFRFVKILCEDGDAFRKGLAYLWENGLELAGAVQDFTDVKTGKNYMFFPIKRL